MSDTPDVTSPKSDLSVLTARTRLPAELHNASGMQKLDWLLSLPVPADFVGALAPDELYYWLRDIGKEDAYPLLEYANAEQLRALVDIDAWNRHELSVPRWLDWLDLALAVDYDTAERFVQAQDDELLLALVTGDIQVLPADTDVNMIPDELQFFSSPDFLYVVTVPREHPLEERLPQLMKLMWSADTDRARELFQQAQFELHEANGEDLERFRTARLQDLGFESVNDAIEVFSTLPIKTLRRELEESQTAEGMSLAGSQPGGTTATQSRLASGMVNDLVLRGVEPPDLLRAAVSALDERDRTTFGNGFAYLTNKVFMAETGDLSRVDDLPEFARAAAAMANLGLSYLALESEERAAQVVRQVTPETLFKAGWTLVFDLSRRARRLAARAGQDRGFSLFGSPYDEVIQAAAFLRPRYPETLDDPGALGARPFATLAELSKVEAYIDEATLVLGAFERHFGLTIKALEEGDLPGLEPAARKDIRLTTLVRTGLLHALLSDEFSFVPVDRDTLVAFSRAAFGKETVLTPAFDETVRVIVESGLEGADELSREAFRGLVSRAVDELVEALGPVHERDIDLRYVGDIFLVSGK